MADLSHSLSLVERKLKCASLYAAAQGTGLDNPAWDEASSRFLIVRLSPWRDVDRSTPHLFLHRLVRATLGVGAFIDFAFFPSKSDRATLDSAGLPWLSGIASRRTADEYDAVLVSFAYALELVNLPSLLIHSGIPARASQRRSTSSPLGSPWPPIVLGGSSALASQGAIFPDGDAFFDAVFFGEGEAGGAELVRSLAQTRALPTAERAAELERSSPAVWSALRGAPGGERPDGKVRRVKPGRCRLIASGETDSEADAASSCEDTSGAAGPLLLDSYPLLNSDEASTARLQISWGCPSFCSFCFEGWERKPYRELPMEHTLECARSLARNTGASTLEIYSFNFNAHERGLELILELNRIFDKVNMMSQRADILAKTPGMIAVELAAEKRSFTVGVEGISASMRTYYSKGLSDEDLRRLFEKLVREKIRELKLFYIIAGIESEADLAEFRRFCAELKALTEERSPGLRVVFSAGYLVRMPFTPLRGTALALERAPLDRIAGELKAAAEIHGFEFRLALDWNEYLADQLMVAGGYGLAAGVEEAALAGTVYDAGIEGDLVGRLVRSLRAAGELVPPSAPEAAEGPRFSGPLVSAKGPLWRYPLDFVDTSVPVSFLDRRGEEVNLRKDTGTCMGDEEGDGKCLGCSACEDEDERAFLGRHRVRPAPGTALADRISATIKEKRRSRAVYIRLKLPASLAGARPAFLSATLMRAALSYESGLIGRLFRIEDALWDSPVWRGRMGTGVTGDTVVALYGIGATDEAGNPRISDEDAEKVREALEAATGASAVRLEAFSSEDLSSVYAVVHFSEGGEALRQVRAWLSSLKLAATERKVPQGRIFDIAPKDRKKRIVVSVELLQESGGETEIRISGGGKLDLSSLLQPGTFATEVTFSRR